MQSPRGTDRTTALREQSSQSWHPKSLQPGSPRSRVRAMPPSLRRNIGYAVVAATFLLLGLLELGPEDSRVISGLPRRLQYAERSLAEQCGQYNVQFSDLQAEGHQRSEDKCTKECQVQEEEDPAACRDACRLHEEDARAVTLQQIMPRRVNNTNIVFVVWFAVGNKGAMWFPSHQFLEPDMHFASALRRSHPGCRIVMMTDQDTKLKVDDDIEIFRYEIDKEIFGRNMYANYFQFQAQIAFLESLEARKAGIDVVFIDMDILVIDSLIEVFCQDYDYGVTVSNLGWDPVNLGVQFIKSSNYAGAISFLQTVLDVYKAGHMTKYEIFTAGQGAIAEACNLRTAQEQNMSAVTELTDAAVQHNVECRLVKGGHRVCFFTCLRYNYYEECMADTGVIQSDDSASLTRNGVKALHFVAYRKPGLDIVWDSYVGPGGSLAAARRTFANLPHDEKGYKKLTGAAEEAAAAAGGSSAEGGRKGGDEGEGEEEGDDDGGLFDPEAVAAAEAAEKKKGSSSKSKVAARRRIAWRHM